MIHHRPLKVDISTTTNSPIVFYLIEMTNSVTGPSIKFDVMICGNENVVVTPGIKVYSLPMDPSSTGFVVPVSELDFFLITLDGSTPTTRCEGIEYQLFADTSGTTWTDIAKVSRKTSVTAD